MAIHGLLPCGIGKRVHRVPRQKTPHSCCASSIQSNTEELGFASGSWAVVQFCCSRHPLLVQRISQSKKKHWLVASGWVALRPMPMETCSPQCVSGFQTCCMSPALHAHEAVSGTWVSSDWTNQPMTLKHNKLMTQLQPHHLLFAMDAKRVTVTETNKVSLQHKLPVLACLV